MFKPLYVSITKSSWCVCLHSAQLCAEVKQSAGRLVQVEQKVQGLGSECERQQQRIREQELELARSATSRSTTTSLQEELQAERSRLIAADKKVSGRHTQEATILLALIYSGPWTTLWVCSDTVLLNA